MSWMGKGINTEVGLHQPAVQRSSEGWAVALGSKGHTAPHALRTGAAAAHGHGPRSCLPLC